MTEITLQAPISTLATQLEAGETTARELVEVSLERIADPRGEGQRAFLSISAERSRAVADGVDAIRSAGGHLPPFAGIPFAVKDLCDVEGEVSTAGSLVLADRSAATANAPALQRLLNAGFVAIGRTNMTEFAYSGLGLNSHFPAPASPWDRSNRHIPGGSSSGTAVAVADGMTAAGLGTDTGGSCRIPAAFCGIVGYKPTARRVPLDGIVPLSTSLDSVGPLANSVECCALLDDLLAGGAGGFRPDIREPGRVRLGMLTDFVLDGLDDTVAAGFEAALVRLRSAGVDVVEAPFPELNQLGAINGKGGLAAAEAFHWHRELLEGRGDDYDQRIRTRIEPGGDITAADYLDVVDARAAMIAAAARRMVGLDAFVLPTVAIVPPTLASFDEAEAAGNGDYYGDLNRLCLRNTSVGNFLDSCSISLPTSRAGEAPVGLMLMGAPMADAGLFSVAATLERLLTNS